MSELIDDRIIELEDYRRAAPDELPGIKDLSSDLGVLIDGIGNQQYRMIVASEYADHLKARFKSGEYSLGSPEYSKDQILPRLYLDLFVATAKRQRLQSLIKHVGRRYSDYEEEPLQELIESKIDFQTDLGEYIALNPEKTSQAMFGNLSTMMMHVRRVVYGDQVSSDSSKKESINQLSAMLAEHKVISTIQQVWPHATLGSVQHDKGGIDIMIPSLDSPQYGVALQVKSSTNPNWKFTIQDEGRSIPKVRVPMNSTIHDPFNLSPDQAGTLLNYVSEATFQDLAPRVWPSEELLEQAA